MDYAFLNGNFLPLSDVSIGICDRSFFFGDGVYDAMVGKMGKIYMLREHLARFRKNLSALSLEVNYTDEELCDILCRLSEKVGEGEQFFYIQANRCREGRIHSAYGCHTANLFAYVRHFTLPDCNRFLSLVTVEDTRYALCHIKTVNLLPNVLASTYAEEMGADEAIFVKDGVVRECSHSNIAILSGGVLLTHPLDCHILPGIMRGALLEMARRMGIVVEERAFSSDALFRAEGVFVTSTTRRVALANSIDGIELAPPSSLAKQLHFLFNRDFFEYMEKNT